MRKILSLALTAAMILSSVACSSKKNIESSVPTEEITVSQTIYKENLKSLPDDRRLFCGIYYTEGIGVRLFYQDKEHVFKTAYYDENMEITNISELFSAENVDQIIFDTDREGNISVFIVYVESDAEIGSEEYIEKAKTSFEIRRFDKNGDPTDTVDVSDLGNYFKLSESFINGFYHYGGNYILSMNSGTLIIGQDGEIIESQEYDSNVSYAEDSEGNYIVSDFNTYGYMDGQTLAEPAEAVEYGKYLRRQGGMFTGTGDFKLFIVLNDGIYGLTYGGSLVQVLDFVDSNVDSTNIYDVAYAGEGKFAVVSDSDAGLQLSLLTVRPDDYVENKETVIVGVATDSGINSIQQEMANSFNKQSDDYKIEMKAYTDTDTLREDILSGSAPDVYIYGDSINMYRLTNMGGLANMYELSEQYGGFTKDDMMPNVIEALEYKGGLYAISQTFSLDMAVANKEVIENGNWNFDEFFSIAENLPDDMYFGNQMTFKTPVDIFRFLCSNNLHAWIDYERAECSFDSPEFVHAMEFCRDANVLGAFDWQEFYDHNTEEEIQIFYTENYNMLKNKTAFLDNLTYMGALSDLGRIRNTFGLDLEQLTYVNPPSNYKSGIVDTGSLFSVIANGNCVEGGWEFVNYVMSDHFLTTWSQTKRDFVVRRESFDKIIEQEQQVSENPDYINDYGILIHDYAFQGVVVTDDEIEKLKDYISTCTVLKDRDDTIWNILEEEFGAFINGEATAQQCAEMIQNRISIYLSEQS